MQILDRAQEKSSCRPKRCAKASRSSFRLRKPLPFILHSRSTLVKGQRPGSLSRSAVPPPRDNGITSARPLVALPLLTCVIRLSWSALRQRDLSPVLQVPHQNLRTFPVGTSMNIHRCHHQLSPPHTRHRKYFSHQQDDRTRQSFQHQSINDNFGRPPSHLNLCLKFFMLSRYHHAQHPPAPC